MKLYKKNIKHAAALTLTLAAIATASQAQETATIRLNGQPLATSVAPVVRNGSTLVPMRDIFEALGATVVWNNRTQAIKAQKGSTDIWLQIGNRTARVNGDETILIQVPILYQQSTMVPLRFVSEALGAQVNWNGERRVVRINTDDRIRGRNPGRINDRGNLDGRDETDVRGTLTIPAGAVIPVTLDSTISSKEARVGDTFSATVKSETSGDSEFPNGTKIFGRITEVQPLANDNPGVLGLEFTAAQLPNGSRMALRGDLTSLDDDSVTQSGGRIMAKQSDDDNNDKTKIIGIGAGAGFILGKVLGKNSLVTAILGAAGGYLYSKNQDKGKEREAIVNEGATLGVRLNQEVTYTDTEYYSQRAPHLD